MERGIMGQGKLNFDDTETPGVSASSVIERQFELAQSAREKIAQGKSDELTAEERMVLESSREDGDDHQPRSKDFW